ncbi:hypothetical protein T484DRAFT_1937740 [Baffinella frigidus]|nr:hypothetical protein T484DRAFT_1937740 [Cryptophyta sp. CCMP2293]
MADAALRRRVLSSSVSWRDAALQLSLLDEGPEGRDRLGSRRSTSARALSADDACPPFQGLDEAPEGLDEPQKGLTNRGRGRRMSVDGLDEAPQGLKDSPRRKRLSVDGAHLRGNGRDDDPAAGKAPEGLKERIRRRIRSVDGALQAGASSGERLAKSRSRSSTEESLSPSSPIETLRRSSVASPKIPSPRNWGVFVSSGKKHLPLALFPLKRQNKLKLEAKSEEEWRRDSLRDTTDHGATLGGALAVSLEHTMVL